MIIKNNSNIFIKGYAGCGKSVLLVHTLIKEKEKNPNAKIIIVTYTHALIDMIKDGIPGGLTHTPIVTFYKFRNMPSHWDLILVDEVQDLPEEDIKAIKLKGDRIIVAGDDNQSIYDEGCNIASMETILQSERSFLSTIHRISRKIRNIAQFFCGDKVGFNSSAIGKLVENDARLVYAENYDEECKWLIKTSKEYADSEYTTAILIPKHIYILHFFQKLLEIEGKPPLPNGADKDKNMINEHLKHNGIKFQYLGNGFGSFEKVEKEHLVTVMTYHSAKGLDYGAVFIPFLSPTLEIWRDNPHRARTLFFVALTRSREQLFLSYSKEKHPLLAEIDDRNFHKINASDELNKSSFDDFDGDDIGPIF